MSGNRLVALVLSGDRRAVRDLYREVESILKDFFKHNIQREEDGDELVQDTFLHLLDALPLYRFESSLRTFVLSIARHELMDYWRKKYAKRLVRTVPLLRDVAASPYRSEVVSKAMQRAIERAYTRLKPDQAQILRWKYEEEMSVKQIAELMGVTTKSAEAQLYRARKAFQLVYEKT